MILDGVEETGDRKSRPPQGLPRAICPRMVLTGTRFSAAELTRALEVVFVVQRTGILEIR
ncbi:hypothetical protein GOAMI_57_00310 [Gordonia amicalis NBRC 100051 = JCM 11271]|nr:hypothetical protein GOAMI_57_00310 [Gordonia amicalis NBRC 100051 = JCM 11271]